MMRRGVVIFRAVATVLVFRERERERESKRESKREGATKHRGEVSVKEINGGNGQQMSHSPIY